ncbi:MAG: DNA-directed RNA polymerase subunit beta [Holosporales bacterium]|jgi:DNA-directed RNA polymerase subunit beta|nr:DNA-directed RNA polymerase subunit beta [Holosporales bacterium]
MMKGFTERKRLRKHFGKIQEIIEVPNLVELQRSSYESFLQADKEPKFRTDEGLQAVFKSVFPMKDHSGRAQLGFDKYYFDELKYDENECRQRGLTFAVPIRVTFQLVVWDIDENTGERSVRDIKEQDVYMGDIPLMTRNGIFIINGVERVVVSQMQRSPGVFFDHDNGKASVSGKFSFSAHVIPYRGSWLDFEFDTKELINIRIDRKRKLPVTTLLMALPSVDAEKAQVEAEKSGKSFDEKRSCGMSKEEILSCFYKKVSHRRNKSEDFWRAEFVPDALRGIILDKDLVDAKTGEVVLKSGTKVNGKILAQLESGGLKETVVRQEDLIGKYSAVDIIDLSNGLVLIEAGDELTEASLKNLKEKGVLELSTLLIDNVRVGGYIRNTLAVDKNNSREEALIDIYRILRPGEPPTIEEAELLFNSLFFDLEQYDLSAVGRVKLNARLEFEQSDTPRVLTKKDILAIVKVLHDLKDGIGEIDDIDNLGNRRVLCVGELLENQFRIGLARIERAIRDRMSSVEIENAMPNDVINAKPISSTIREFFAGSQLSQFMDQTNPLAEISHKRRVSSLGPGGLSRDRAGLEVRDVHTTHYGRICPIETPEGPNIGLINSLAIFARINKYGFIEAPYRKVKDGCVTDEIVYLSALEEAKFKIAQVNSETTADGKLVDELVVCRKGEDIVIVSPKSVDFIDVSPKQVVSAAAALIPALGNDDASRALMGSNMQRQAVPLLKCRAPLVGTGFESKVARDSGVTIIARRDGIVDQVDAKRIVIKATGKRDFSSVGVDIYTLRKFECSNQNTCINQRPLVSKGDIIKAGDIIADGQSTDLGELALGENVLAAFMLWRGQGFEDAIIVSERLVSNDNFTSVHMEEFEVIARDTKLGSEEITRDIPNMSEERLCSLDEAGVVYIGAEVKAGDVLVGKVTPKGESLLSIEEKLLRAIFGERASEVRDTSLRVPPGACGTVVDVKVFSRSGLEKDERALAIDQVEIDRLSKDLEAEKAIIEKDFYSRLEELLKDEIIASAHDKKFVGKKITDAILSGITKRQWRQVVVENKDAAKAFERLINQFDSTINVLKKKFEDRVEKLKKGDDLAPGIIKIVRVYVASKRKIQPGDKMAGRHGNKGVISKVVPIEDMPHMEDGTPIDIILNPLGIPSRMNIGQILEIHLGMAAYGFGKQIEKTLANIASKEKNLDAVRDKIKDIYTSKSDRKEVDKLGDYEIAELATNLTKGVPVAIPIFDGATNHEISENLKMAGCNSTGKVRLIDGRTGEYFDQEITVGCLYMIKLDHMVDDKMHARSVGPYSLVTQQPLGGKAQFGGQRFGEMEVWALQAYGAAYTLQEMLTVKSDDVEGRTKAYETIVKGNQNIEPGMPESFNVLVKELNALAFNLEFLENNTVSKEGTQ